jgi:glutaconate CoA-transferase subunit B
VAQTEAGFQQFLRERVLAADAAAVGAPTAPDERASAKSDERGAAAPDERTRGSGGDGAPTPPAGPSPAPPGQRTSPPDVAPYSPADLMACVIARLLRDGETVFFGLASPLAMLGVLLAKETHAPGLTVLNIPGGMGDAVARLPRSTVDASLTGGSRSLFTLAEVFDLSARGRLDTVLLSGVQIDHQGRINMSVIGDRAQPRVALPGGAGSALLLPTAGRTILWRSKHDARTFVERLDYVTAAGATSHVVTPLCLFERRASVLEVASIHPGVALETLQQATGWPVGAAPETPPPTAHELATLARLDPENVRAAEF